LSALSDRIRGIVGPSAATATANPASPAASQSQSPIPNPQSQDLSLLNGEWRDGCFVVERRWNPEALHGRDAIGTFAECLDESASEAPLFGDGARAPFVFFDLETTGLSGGAGTLAFLVGCGSFQSDGGFATRQFLLATPPGERRMLEAAHAALAPGTIVSFNGKSFDAPLLESRFAYHRLALTLAGQPHMDALHPSRQFWASSTPGPSGSTDCSLTSLERRLLAVRRKGDVDGFEVPARYFQFLRSGDARPLEAVLEHNRRDLLTLAALTTRLLHLARSGADGARTAREAIALGRVYARAGDDRRARPAFERAVDVASARHDDAAMVDALRGLAAVLRRTRAFGEAAVCWQRLIDMDACPAAAAREAAEALAIHHEHRVRDLAAAKTFALKSLEIQRTPRWTEGVRYRVARIERKISGRLL